MQWCKNHKIPKSGTKKELIKRIIDHLAGKDVTTKKAKAKKVAPKKKVSYELLAVSDGSGHWHQAKGREACRRRQQQEAKDCSISKIMICIEENKLFTITSWSTTRQGRGQKLF